MAVRTVGDYGGWGWLQFKNLLGWLTGSISWLEWRLQVKASLPCMQVLSQKLKNNANIDRAFLLKLDKHFFMIWSKHNGKTLGKERWPRRKGKKKRPVKMAYSAIFWQNLKLGKKCLLAIAILRPGSVFSSVLENKFSWEVDKPTHKLTAY